MSVRADADLQVDDILGDQACDELVHLGEGRDRLVDQVGELSRTQIGGIRLPQVRRVCLCERHDRAVCAAQRGLSRRLRSRPVHGTPDRLVELVAPGLFRLFGLSELSRRLRVIPAKSHGPTLPCSPHTGNAGLVTSAKEPNPTAPATFADLDRLCRALPEVTLGTSWGDLPTYLVANKPKPRGFVLFRAPRPAEKAALVEDADLPFFTIEHFRNYNAVLIQQSRLGEVSVGELTEVVADAWLTVAPKRLAKEFLARDVGARTKLDP